MFKRNQKPTIQTRIREGLWPSMGWQRYWRYLKLRVNRLPGSPRGIAGGIAIGAAVSMTPLIGLHVLLALGLAWAFKRNIIAALIGTAVGNPWSFPFIWWMSYSIGDGILSLFDMAHDYGGVPLLVLRIDQVNPDMDLFPVIFANMIIGCIPMMIVTWFVVYRLCIPIITRFQNKRRQRRLKKMRAT
ncbi:MAG: DUF2062 domain-containing protein [Pseudomonadota bacterium]